MIKIQDRFQVFSSSLMPPIHAIPTLVRSKQDLIQSEAQSLVLIQQLILTTFSCVGYLRDLFDDSCFDVLTLDDLSLKKLKRNKSKEADMMLDWIERGCFDAIEKKYLKMAVFGIYLDQRNPYDMAETYTFRISYPDGSNASESLMSIERNDVPIIHISHTESKFKESAIKLLRSLCVMVQTLKGLPETKYLTMKLFYYDERTPVDYQPPFFKESPSEDLSGFTFRYQPTKMDFNTIETPYHSIHVKLQSIADDLGISVSDTDTAQKEKDVYAPVLSQQDLLLLSMKDEKTPTGSSSHNNSDFITRTSHICATDPAQTPNSTVQLQPILKDAKTVESPKVLDRDDLISCACGCNVTDLDMIFCGKCKVWMHTVCMGFFSNQDKRLPSGEFTCLKCLYGEFKNVWTFLCKLAAWRRSLSIVFHEGIKSKPNFSRRLGLARRITNGIIRRLIREGFVQNPNASTYVAVKNVESKRKIKFYFDLSLEVFPEFVSALNNDKPQDLTTAPSMTTPRKIRKSSDPSQLFKDVSPSKRMPPSPKSNTPDKHRKISIADRQIECI